MVFTRVFVPTSGDVWPLALLFEAFFWKMFSRLLEGKSKFASMFLGSNLCGVYGKYIIKVCKELTNTES